jgi:putative transposase
LAGGAARDRRDDQGPRLSLCRELDEQVDAFRHRPLEGAYPYLWLDAKHVKVRDHARVVSKALVVAYAVHQTGVGEVIGIDIGEVESGAFWTEFLRSLKKRGADGVRLAVSDQHEGLKTATAWVLACRGNAAPSTSSETW